MFSLNKLSLIVLIFLFSSNVSAKNNTKHQIGRTVTAEEISGWDIDIRPDGKGLPKGQGSAILGEAIYENKCATCHGSFGEGEGRWPVLAGGENSLTEERPEKTVGSYWPYASTLWDYINRAMPFPSPKTLTVEEVYSLTAYVLYLNDIIEEDFILTEDNLAKIDMPNKDGFYVDNRPDSSNIRCMKNCKDPASITVIPSLRGITPEQKAEVNKPEPNTLNETLLSSSAIKGEAIYSASCVACHGNGIAGAPKFGDEKAWKNRLKQKPKTLIKNAINGFTGNTGIMPPKGGNLDLSDEQVAAAVQFIIESNQ